MILVVQNIPCLAESLRPQHEVMSVPYTLIDNALLKHCGCTALFVRTTTKVNASLLEGTQVSFVGTATSGVDHVQVQYLQQHDIRLASAAGSNANAVAEWVLYAAVKRALERGQSLRGLTFGLVGFGHIGKLVAGYMQRLGMRVIVNDPPLEQQGVLLPASLHGYRSLAQLVEEADVISNHVPFQKEGPYSTADLFSEELVQACRPGIHFIHSSRGGIVDESALMKMLDNPANDVSIDVWSNEPQYSLELARRVRLATPHISGHSEDGILDAAERLLHAYELHSGLQYNTECIDAARPRQLLDFGSLCDSPDLSQVLCDALKLETRHEALRHPLSDSPAGRHEHFLEQRFSYTGRREVFLRPHLL